MKHLTCPTSADVCMFNKIYPFTCRWLHYLDPTVNRGPWTPEEDRKLVSAYEEHGTKWSKIVKLKLLPGRYVSLWFGLCLSLFRTLGSVVVLVTATLVFTFNVVASLKLHHDSVYENRQKDIISCCGFPIVACASSLAYTVAQDTL